MLFARVMRSAGRPARHARTVSTGEDAEDERVEVLRATVVGHALVH